jgi:hypothetical protein
MEHRRQSRDNEERHVALALRGRIKGETGEKFHLVPLASLTTSGITNAVWFDRGMDLCRTCDLTWQRARLMLQ